MAIKIAHLSDIHIRNLKYHDVYREVFNNLYVELETQDVDYIVVTGDVAHTKTQISPEYVAMASDFFDKLSNIAKTIVIPGNHDGNLKNPSRLDAITPIVNNLNKNDIYFSRDSDVITFEDVDFYHLSVFDTENWPQIIDNSKINIALFHGAVSGIKTDMGHEITHGDAELSDFEHFDYGLFGDIHKTNQKIT
jgi:DNA repair exonuclease SbcCD nuclease subunit